MPRAGCSMKRWCFGSTVQRARLARISPNFNAMAAAPLWMQCLGHSDRLRACGLPLRGSSHVGLSSWLDRPRAEPLKNGVRVVVAGPTNAGKSSLLNAIAGEDRAIVTDIPGTTRDHIEVPLSFDGVPIVLTDTAGPGGSGEPAERIGGGPARVIAER